MIKILCMHLIHRMVQYHSVRHHQPYRTLSIYQFIVLLNFLYSVGQSQRLKPRANREGHFSLHLFLAPLALANIHESPTGGTQIFQLSLYLVPVGGFEFPSSAVQSSCDPIVRAHGRQRIHHDTKHPTNIHIISRYAANKRLHAKQSIHKALWNALEKTKKNGPIVDMHNRPNNSKQQQQQKRSFTFLR